MVARWYIYVFVMFLTMANHAEGNDVRQALVSGGEVLFNVDWKSFRSTEEKTYVELDMLLFLNGFSFVQDEDRHRTDYQVHVRVFSPESSSVEVDQIWRRGMDLSSSEKNRGGTSILDVFSFTLFPGTYQLLVEVIDSNSSAEGICRGELHVQGFDQKTLSTSDLQLASGILNSAQHGRFVKNGKRVVPSITGRFLENQSSLHVYYEIYNLSSGGSPNTFDLAYSILDTTGFKIRSYSSRKLRKPGGSCVITDSLDIQRLDRGHYFLQVLVKDNDTKKIITRKQPFEIWSLQEVSLATDDASLERYYDQIRYIAKREELDEYRRLDPEEKARFVLAFWKKRDPTPDTPENEFAAEHFKRIQYADINFPALPKHKGSDTDQGRVYIIYGLPDHVERNDYHSVGKPYLTWSYEQLGYYQFIFVDKRGTGVPELVHSTMLGELYNPNWLAETVKIHDRAGALDRIDQPNETIEEQEP